MNGGISIIIPTCNAGRYLPRCIDSLQILQGHAHEVVFIDFMSMDTTEALIRSISSLNVRFLRASSRGIYAAMNYGIRAAVHERLYFMGSDDVLLDDFPQAISLASSPYSVFSIETEAGRNIQPRTVRYSAANFRRGRFLTPHHQSVIFHRTFFQQHGFYNENLSLCSDAELFLRPQAEVDSVQCHSSLCICSVGLSGVSADFKAVWRENRLITSQSRKPSMIIIKFDLIMTSVRILVRKILWLLGNGVMKAEPD